MLHFNECKNDVQAISLLLPDATTCWRLKTTTMKRELTRINIRHTLFLSSVSSADTLAFCSGSSLSGFKYCLINCSQNIFSRSSSDLPWKTLMSVYWLTPPEVTSGKHSINISDCLFPQVRQTSELFNVMAGFVSVFNTSLLFLCNKLLVSLKRKRLIK